MVSHGGGWGWPQCEPTAPAGADTVDAECASCGVYYGRAAQEVDTASYQLCPDCGHDVLAEYSTEYA